MRAILSRLRRLERGTDKPISLLWLDQQHDGMTARDFECAAPFEVPKNARDGLNG